MATSEEDWEQGIDGSSGLRCWTASSSSSMLSSTRCRLPAAHRRTKVVKDGPKSSRRPMLESAGGGGERYWLYRRRVESEEEGAAGVSAAPVIAARGGSEEKGTAGIGIRRGVETVAGQRWRACSFTVAVLPPFHGGLRRSKCERRPHCCCCCCTPPAAKEEAGEDSSEAQVRREGSGQDTPTARYHCRRCLPRWTAGRSEIRDLPLRLSLSASSLRKDDEGRTMRSDTDGCAAHVCVHRPLRFLMPLPLLRVLTLPLAVSSSVSFNLL